MDTARVLALLVAWWSVAAIAAGGAHGRRRDSSKMVKG